ncbi:MAG: LexA family protein [Coriobacteriia bacterium]
MMSTGENIRTLRVLRGITQQQLADKVGVSGAAVSEWERGQNEPRSAALQKIAEVFDVTMEDIIKGTDVSLALEPQGAYTSELKAPLYGRIAAGVPIAEIPVEDSHWVNPEVLAKHPRGFYLRVEGESMNRVLPNGCLAFVDPAAEVRNGDIAALHVNGYDATIKRYHRIGNDVILEPDSRDPQYGNELFDATKPGAQEICVIGRVVWHVVPFDGA